MKKLANNKKGFSLIELIIVIAIMVALIAVMAPNFVKYVQKSRDTALSTAAEDFLSTVKVFYGDPDNTDATIPDDGSQIIIYVDGTLQIEAGADSTIADLDEIIAASGADMEKGMGSTKDVWIITINDGPTFKMEGSTNTGA